jgi:hypothetical protein
MNTYKVYPTLGKSCLCVTAIHTRRYKGSRPIFLRYELHTPLGP